MNDIFSIFSFVAVVIYFLSKHSEVHANLNKMQKIAVLISFIITMLISGYSIYYGASFLTQNLQNGFLVFIIRIIVVMVILWLAAFTWNNILQKITKGIFPEI